MFYFDKISVSLTKTKLIIEIDEQNSLIILTILISGWSITGLLLLRLFLVLVNLLYSPLPSSSQSRLN